MKLTVTLTFLFAFTLNSFAASIDGIEPTLRFDERYDKTTKGFTNNYLNVIVESARFPAGSQEAKFQEALDILPEVMNSDEFRKKVLTFVNSKGENRFNKNYLWKDSTKRLTNEDVYNIIMLGDELMRPDTLGEMNINSYVKKCRFPMSVVHRWCTGVIGSTSPYNSKWMKLNWKFYKRFETHEMVSNIVHEWLHLLGFLHGKTNIREEVPYVVGGIAAQVAKRILEERR